MEVLHNIIKLGVVSSVDAQKGTARVAFEERGGLVSGDLQVLQRNTLKNKDWNMPDVGEHVLCLFMPNGLEHGFILGAVYSEADAPPSAASADKRRVDFEDGSFVEFDRSTKKLTVDCQGEIFVKAKAKVTIQTDADVLVDSGGDATVKATGKVIIDAPLCDISGPGGAGLVTGQSICHFTGTPHMDVSTKVTAGK